MQDLLTPHSLTEHLENRLLGLRLLALPVHVRVLGEVRSLPDLKGKLNWDVNFIDSFADLKISLEASLSD